MKIFTRLVRWIKDLLTRREKHEDNRKKEFLDTEKPRDHGNDVM